MGENITNNISVNICLMKLCFTYVRIETISSMCDIVYFVTPHIFEAIPF